VVVGQYDVAEDGDGDEFVLAEIGLGEEFPVTLLLDFGAAVGVTRWQRCSADAGGGVVAAGNTARRSDDAAG